MIILNGYNTVLALYNVGSIPSLMMYKRAAMYLF